MNKRENDTWRVISIHALRGEGDNNPNFKAAQNLLFQSTPSVGRATVAKVVYFRTLRISIHALRGEGDKEPDSIPKEACNISIHALRGEGDVHSRE